MRERHRPPPFPSLPGCPRERSSNNILSPSWRKWGEGGGRTFSRARRLGAEQLRRLPSYASVSQSSVDTLVTATAAGLLRGLQMTPLSFRKQKATREAAQETSSNQAANIPSTPQSVPHRNGYTIPSGLFQEKAGGASGYTASTGGTSDGSKIHASPKEPSPHNLSKPALPPKPSQAPPIYREPPRPQLSSLEPRPPLPPTGRDPQQPTASDLSASNQNAEAVPPPSQPPGGTTGGAESSRVLKTEKVKMTDHRDHMTFQSASRTEAWVHEHKTPGKHVGERFTSLHRKLRSLLNHSPPQTGQKESPVSSGSKLLSGGADVRQSYGDGLDNPALSVSVDESSQRVETRHVIGCPSSNHDQHRILAEATPAGGAYHHPMIGSGRPGQDRHPFQPTPEGGSSELVSDTAHLRDACNRLFPREQRTCWNNYLTNRSSYTNNIKSTYEYDKVMPKECIGKSSLDRKTADSMQPHTATPSHNPYESLPPFPSLVKGPDPPRRREETAPPSGLQSQLSSQDTRYYYLRDFRRFRGEEEVPRREPSGSFPPTPPVDRTHPETPKKIGSRSQIMKKDGSLRDLGDTSDQYKSSSESGRGTMHSGVHSSKSPVSVNSSVASAGSALDTSVDSDHSVGGGAALWQQSRRASLSQSTPHLTSSGVGAEVGGTVWSTAVGKQLRHIIESHTAPSNGRKGQDVVDNDPGCVAECSGSESLSVTPPLPPLSPPPSPPLSDDNSPQVSPKAKYKLSFSTTALNSPPLPTSIDQGSKSIDPVKASLGVMAALPCKTSPGKKNGVRRTSSITQGTCRHWTAKSKTPCRTPGPSTHRPTHVTCNGTKKGQSSPPLRHTRIPLAHVPGLTCYGDLGDQDVTSTTTGLDMESLLDDPDDFSSEMSATTSNMDAAEVAMIRKQLEGLETMYSEILRLLGVKTAGKGCSSSDLLRQSRRRVHGSLSSLTGRSSVSRGTYSFRDKRGCPERRRTKDSRGGAASKRLQRLESHVVTLARSVAHLSSEMRTQHMLIQELESLRRDVTWVQEKLRLLQLSTGGAVGGASYGSSRGSKNHQMPLSKEWETFRAEVLELLNPSRAQKLTKFFGDEPPLIRQFLKRLGYEKYASNFESERIGIMELPYLTEERLQKIGIPMGPRMRILQEAQASFRQNQYKVYIV